MLSSIIEHVSWTDDEDIQEMWSGLLTSSCTKDGKDDSNLIFINTLSQLTNLQVKILNFACNNAKKYASIAGWIGAEELTLTIEKLQEVSQIEDFHRLDRELDHLRALDLLDDGGFDPNSTDAIITPTPLALHLFVRCQGSFEDPIKYFGDEIIVEKPLT